MTITEKQSITKEVEVVIGFKCDNCGIVHHGEYIPAEWHEFEARHYSRGYDSDECRKTYTACSPYCYGIVLQKAVDDFKNYNAVEIDDMDYAFAQLLAFYINNKT